MAGVKGRSGGRRPGTGGPRPGAGRKPKPPPRRRPKPPHDPFPAILLQVRRYAEAGVDEPTIMEALAVDEAKLKADGQLESFRQLVSRALATCRAELAVEIKARSQRSRKNAGSVNALALRARNQLGWDRQSLQDEQKPDVTGARERLRLEFQRLAQNAEARLGRPVEPEDVLFQEVFSRWPWEQEAPA